MPTNRRAKQRPRRKQLNTAAVKAWLECDYLGLHAALNLAPSERSPLPLMITPLGVDEWLEPDPEVMFDRSIPKALALQRELIEAAGPPDRGAMRRELEKHLTSEVEYLRYLKDPNPHEKTFGGSYSREEQIADTEARIRQLKACLKAIDAWRADMAASVGDS
jgi:hypothetical protein